jgi:CubicO group peptidase (beta-lactamase class C family)
MLKNVAAIGAALILAAAAFSTSAEARRGSHFSGARVGSFSGAHIGAAPFRGARIATAPFSGHGIYRGGGGPGRYGYGYRYRGYRYGYRYPGYGYGWPLWGWGLAAGASAWPYYYGDYDSAVAYCMRRFRSYDPASRTYLGYDGYRHSCP